MEFSRQEYWNGLPFASPGNLPDPEIEPGYPASQADSSPSEPQGKPGMRELDHKKGPVELMNSTVELTLSNCGAGEDS